MPRRLSISELPAGPKRLANAFIKAGWTWNAEEATGTYMAQHVYSVVVRGKGATGKMVAARWEAVDRGKLQVNKCYMIDPEVRKGEALPYSVTEVFSQIV